MEPKSLKEGIDVYGKEKLQKLVNKSEDLFRLHPVLREAGFGSEQDGYEEQKQTRKSLEESFI